MQKHYKLIAGLLVCVFGVGLEFVEAASAPSSGPSTRDAVAELRAAARGCAVDPKEVSDFNSAGFRHVLGKLGPMKGAAIKLAKILALAQTDILAPDLLGGIDASINASNAIKFGAMAGEVQLATAQSYAHADWIYNAKQFLSRAVSRAEFEKRRVGVQYICLSAFSRFVPRTGEWYFFGVNMPSPRGVGLYLAPNESVFEWNGRSFVLLENVLAKMKENSCTGFLEFLDGRSVSNPEPTIFNMVFVLKPEMDLEKIFLGWFYDMFSNGHDSIVFSAIQYVVLCDDQGNPILDEVYKAIYVPVIPYQSVPIEGSWRRTPKFNIILVKLEGNFTLKPHKCGGFYLEGEGVGPMC